MSFFKKFIGKGNQNDDSKDEEPKSSPDKPYDESVDVPDEGDEDIQTPKSKNKLPSASEIERQSDDESEGEDEAGSDDDQIPTGEGAYDPSEFQNLPVTTEIKDLFAHITQYIPQNLELDTFLRPFIPDFIPAVGDIDAFIKIPRPDDIEDNLGLIVLDEPCADQSDSVVMDLHLRAISKNVAPKSTVVKNLARADKNGKEIETWIKNISDLHRSKPATNVHYSKPMPDIDSLMQEWPHEIEELLKVSDLPGSDMDLKLEEYVDLICALMDVPVYKSRIQSLHVLFTLYSEFKNSQHFRALADDNLMDNDLKEDADYLEL